MYLEALVAVEVGPLELLHPLLHDLLRQQRHRHLHEQEVPRAIKHQAATNAEREAEDSRAPWTEPRRDEVGEGAFANPAAMRRCERERRRRAAAAAGARPEERDRVLWLRENAAFLFLYFLKIFFI